MKVSALVETNFSDNEAVRGAIATLIENLPASRGLGFYRSRIAETEESCLIVLAFDPRDVARVITKLELAIKQS